MNDIKPRTVYFLRRTDKEDDGSDRYVGSTSMNLKYRLSSHKCPSNYMSRSKLYKKMRKVGINNWEIIPLLSFACNKNTILKLEKVFIKTLNTDLNTNSPFTGFNKKEYTSNYNKVNKGAINHQRANYYKSIIQGKVHHCGACKKSFLHNNDLRRHLRTLKHSYTYLNSLD